MKKALVILLTLAVAGGLFAQTYTWSGDFGGGIGLLNMDGADDPVFGVVSPHHGANGVRGQVQLTAVNANNTAGFSGQLRATGNPESGLGIGFNHAFGWVRFADMLRLTGGLYEDGFLGTKAPFVGGTLYNQYGMTAHIMPMDMVTVGVGVFGTDGLAPEMKPMDEQGLGLWGGLGLDFGIADVQAQVKYLADDITAQFGVGVNVLPILPIHANVRLERLDDFSNAGLMVAHAFVGLNIVQDLGITLGGGVSMSQVDDSDMAMVFGGMFEYTLGNIIPRLDLWYVSGGTYGGYGSFGNGAAVENGNFNSSHNADDSYFSVRARVCVRIAGDTRWTIGGLFNVGLGDDGNAESGTNIGFFTGVRTSF